MVTVFRFSDRPYVGIGILLLLFSEINRVVGWVVGRAWVVRGSWVGGSWVVGSGSCLFEDKKRYTLAPSVLGPNLS